MLCTFVGSDIPDDGQDGNGTQDVETLNDGGHDDKSHTEIQEPPTPQISQTDLGIHWPL